MQQRMVTEDPDISVEATRDEDEWETVDVIGKPIFGGVTQFTEPNGETKVDDSSDESS